MKKHLYILLSIIILIAGCKAIQNINLYDTSEDIKLGNQVKEQIKADKKNYPISTNSEIKTYVQDVINQIISSPKIKYKGKFFYTVEIINDDNVINAFCTPGGYIYVYTGLLKFIDNEATLAAVLAHEIAHAECRHSTKRMSQNDMIGALAKEYQKKNNNETTKTLTNITTSLTLLNNSRDDEYEADENSFNYLRTTKWYPGGIKFFFDKIMTAYNAGGNRFEQLLATHPLPKDRIEKAVNLLKNNNILPPTEDNLYYKKYQDFKNKHFTNKK